MGKGFHFDKDDLDFMKDVMEHSDGSERKIGDFVIRNDYGANLYYEGNGGDVIIPEEVGSAGLSFTFKSERANNIRSLEYPSCIECIWADEIVPMRNTLEKVVFHEGLDRILGAGAFANFMKLKDVKLPKSLCYLGSNAFKNTGITALDFKTIEMSDNTNNKDLKIAANAFSDCADLTTITFGNITVSNTGKFEIYGTAFTNNPKLTKVTFGETTYTKAGTIDIKDNAFAAGNVLLSEVEFGKISGSANNASTFTAC